MNKIVIILPTLLFYGNGANMISGEIVTFNNQHAAVHITSTYIETMKLNELSIY